MPFSPYNMGNKEVWFLSTLRQIYDVKTVARSNKKLKAGLTLLPLSF